MILSKVKNYNVAMLLNNVISIIYTKIFWKKARLIRYPICVFGKQHMKYEEGLTIGKNSKIDMVRDCKKNIYTLIIGKNCIFGEMLHIAANNRVIIGNNLLAASRVFITDTNHGIYIGEKQDDPQVEPISRKLSYKDTIIGNNVWIGENVSILAGSRVGNGCIVAANSVVTKSFDDNCIIAGNPARIIKKYDSETKKWCRIY